MKQFDDALKIFESVLGEFFITRTTNDSPNFDFFLASQLKLYGFEKHPLIADTLYEIGEQWRLLGDLSKSREIHEKAFVIREATLNSQEHPSINKSKAILNSLKE